MVSKYAELIAKTGPGVASPKSPPDKLAKIDRLLKSQWEDRLKKHQNSFDQQDSSPSERVDVTLETKQAPHLQQVTTHQQPQEQQPVKTSQKSILREPRLQLSKETLLQLREPSSLQDLIFETSSPTTLSNVAPLPSPSPLASSNIASNKSNVIPNTQSKLKTPLKPDQSDSSPKPSTCFLLMICSSNLFFVFSERGSGGRPGFITCAICNITKYYSHVQRRHGQFSCGTCSCCEISFTSEFKVYRFLLEPCSKFFGRFLRNPKQYYCPKNGKYVYLPQL